MREGKRALYRGKEFEYITTDEKIYMLFSREKAHAPSDFELNQKGNYQKFVSRDDLEDIYYIRQFAKYRGHTFPIWEMSEDSVLLGEGSYTKAEEVGFPPSELPWERGLYKKWILKSDVEAIWEEKRPL
ncbi:hypothetical protein ACFFIX_16980 [Metabacillus herbersteinensis]|uniref:Uncharacterized protein n=1 Tax=Metabacillus herbersteinensis TaxID=283816 RepID=A0ABV6GHE4_9BACI